MNTYINYYIEANLGLAAVLGFYLLMLRHETNFGFKRAFLLVGISTSLLFPLISFPLVIQSLPTIGEVIPQRMLPPPVAILQPAMTTSATTIDSWAVLGWIYALVTVVLSATFIIRLIRLTSFLRKSKGTVYLKKYHVIVSDQDLPTFSFFNQIFIGRSNLISSEEKEQIIQHEIIHGQEIHSADVLLVEIVRIIFWFNPIVYYLKLQVSNVHEFQADQLVARNGNIEEYCHLLSKVALQSAEFRFVNHFNSSLTLKRIGVLRSKKTTLSRWKVASVGPFIFGLFLFMACQDQLSQDGSASLPPLYSKGQMPIIVKENLEKLQKIYPKSEFIVIEKSKEGNETLKQISLRKDVGTFSSFPVIEGEVRHDFVIVELTDRTLRRNSLPRNENETFIQVDESAAPVFGIDQLYANIGYALRYPEEAKSKGVEGTVEVEFIVGTDGKISDVRVSRGINEYLDAEAIRVLYQVGNNWDPAIFQGQVVRQRVLLPVSFSLNSSREK